MKLPRVDADLGVDAELQPLISNRRWKAGATFIGLLVGAGLVQAQEAGGTARTGLSFLPRMSLNETLTDNLNLSAADKDAALVTTVSPGLRIDSRSGRIRGTFDYSLNGIIYTKSQTKNQVQNALTAQGVAELIENKLFVDAQASISRQAISAFGQQSSDSALNNSNTTEVASVSVSPYWRGRISNWASFELRGNAAATNSKQTDVGDSHTDGGSLRINEEGGGQVNWWTSVSTQSTDFKTGNVQYRTLAANIGLTYRPDVDYQFTVNGGPERNNYGGGETVNGSDYGISATWTPSPRTKLTADWQHHSYGNGHTLNFEHRMARSVWRYSDVQSVTLGTPNGAGGATTLYNLFYQQCVASQTDVNTCPTTVNDFLLSRGLNPSTTVSGGFVASTPTLQRLQNLAFSLEGVRSSILASLSETSSSLLSGAQAGVGDLAHSSVVRQRGVTLTVSHHLTPDSSAYATWTSLQSQGDSATFSTGLRSITANWSGRLGHRLAVTLGARHSTSTGTSAYSENAVTANLVQQF